ncbi:hypothetical protein [Nocardia shimofusensis]|uniref:hypothetical protein n=1 Tax=Nocardia shimofusensis TaxID=228596 RepID=UPI000ABCBBD8|nr:hypothetical protein [Nocardia shimofusensis]
MTRHEDSVILDRDPDPDGKPAQDREQVAVRAAVGVADRAAHQRWDTDGGDAGR